MKDPKFKKCSVCGEPAPWLFAGKVPLYTSHFDERNTGSVFIIEIKKGRNMARILNDARIDDYTGDVAKIPQAELGRTLGFSSLEKTAIIYIQKPMFQEFINSIYHDQPK